MIELTEEEATKIIEDHEREIIRMFLKTNVKYLIDNDIDTRTALNAVFNLLFYLTEKGVRKEFRIEIKKMFDDGFDKAFNKIDEE